MANEISNELNKVLSWGEAEVKLLFAKTPQVVKDFEDETLHVCTVIKSALTSPEGTAIETILEQLIPGGWVAEVATKISGALATVIPELTVLANSGGTLIDDAAQLVKYIQTLTPKMQHSGLLKLLSSLFQALDPTLTEVETDTSAQVLYAKTVLAK